MKLVLLFLCIPILFACPILYPPIASFTAISFTQKKGPDIIALFLLFSSAIVTSLINATIIPFGDTERYIESFQEIQLFDFTELKMDNAGFEPLYKIYEYILSLFIGDSQNLFLLTTALIIHITTIIAILRICHRLEQPKLAGIILTAHYSLFAPALGVPVFLLRSSLSIAILLLGISFYNQIPAVFYLLGAASFFIHSSSLLIFGTLILRNYLHPIVKTLQILIKKIFFISFTKKSTLKMYLLIFFLGFMVVFAAPSLVNSVLQGSLSSLSASTSKAQSFLDAAEEGESFVDLKNPVVLIQIAVSLLCFFRIEPNLLPKAANNQTPKELNEFLESLRAVGRLLITIIIFTAPFNVFPYRMGFFNFVYFPLWLINVPYLKLNPKLKNRSKHLIVFTLVLVLLYSLVWIPKREGNEYQIVVLEGKPMRYTLTQIIELFIQ